MEVEPLVMVEPCGMEQLLYSDTNEVRNIVLLDSFTYSSAGRDTKILKTRMEKELLCMLPNGFNYVVEEFNKAGDGFCASFRLPISNKQEALKWVAMSEEKSMTTFRIKRSYPENTDKVVFKQVESEHLMKFDPAEAAHDEGLFFTPLVAVKSEELEREDTNSSGTVPSATVKVEDIYIEDHVIEYPEEISLEDMFGEKSSPNEVASSALHQFEQQLAPHPLSDSLSELNAENSLEPEEQEPDPRNICHICGRELSDAWNLKRHYLVHSQDRPHKCELCGRGFNQSTHLKAHILTHTERQALQCGECGKVFSVSRNLRRHLLTHSPTKPHICPVCNKGFVQASDLKTHSLTHSGGALPHVCTVCGKGFARSYHLRTHATIHTGEKPHICKVCGKRFRDAGFLRKHGRTHAPNKKSQHACTVCGKTFSQSSHLKKHSLVHSRVA